VTALHSRRSFLALASTAALAGAGAVGASEPTDAARNVTDAGAADQPTRSATRTPPPTAARTPTRTPAQSIGDHPTFGVGPARTGDAGDEAGPAGPVVAQWCVGSAASGRPSPLAVVEGTAYVGSPGEGLRALDAATGDLRWRARIDAGAPTVVGDRLYAADDAAVVALGTGSGRELWATRPGGQVTTAALVAGDGRGTRLVIVGEAVERDDGERRGGRIHALDAADGSTRWRTRLDGGVPYGALAARDGLVYGGGATHRFYALDAATGEVRWRADLGDHATSPAVGPDAVVVGDEAGTVHARWRRTGTERWSYDAGAEVRTSPAVAGGRVYVAGSDGDLHAVDAASGRRRWRFDGGRRLTTAPTVGGGASGRATGTGTERAGGGRAVYVGSAEGNLFAVDAATGEKRWSAYVAAGVETEPAVVDGTVLVGDGDGRIHAFVDRASATPGSGCRPTTETSTPDPERRDADGDGVPDRQDYAPRDGSVQRRADVANREGDDLGFVEGAGVGAVAASLGAGVGWVLGTRGSDD
jgi:outer membrane protein assembly factor BamB